jgi:predicted TIM-barrel fold metal-dependent hydrolase
MRHRVTTSRVLSLSTTCLLAVLAICSSGCVSAPAGGTTQAPGEQPLAVIDAHVRTNFSDAFYEPGKVMDSKAELAAEMKKYNVVGAVSMNHAGDAYADLSDLNVVQCAGLSGKVDAERLEADLASGRLRCITIYLGYEHQYASDPNYEPAYRLAEKYRVPVVFHTGNADNPPAMPKYADPLTVDEVAVDHPKVTFVLAHAGNPRTADQRDRDEFFERRAAKAVVRELWDDPWIQPAAAVAHKNPNVVLDGSGFLMGDLLTTSPGQIETYLMKRVRWVFDNVGDPTKLIFGTGWPGTEIGPYLEVFKLTIPKQYWQAVFHDNAARVYGFDTKAAAK